MADTFAGRLVRLQRLHKILIVSNSLCWQWQPDAQNWTMYRLSEKVRSTQIEELTMVTKLQSRPYNIGTLQVCGWGWVWNKPHLRISLLQCLAKFCLRWSPPHQTFYHTLERGSNLLEFKANHRHYNTCLLKIFDFINLQILDIILISLLSQKLYIFNF